jgi:HK97 family phage prohead protease
MKTRAVHLSAQRLNFDTASRQISGLAVPFGPTARTIMGDVTFGVGDIRIPLDLSRIKLLMGHDTDRPVGYATVLTETVDGIEAVFKLPPGEAGDQALDDAATGLRDGLSVGVQLDDDVAERLWNSMPGDPPVQASGQMKEVSLCAIPAFDDARVAHVAASYQGDNMGEENDPRQEHGTHEGPAAEAEALRLVSPSAAAPATGDKLRLSTHFPAVGRRDTGGNRNGAEFTLRRVAQIMAAVNSDHAEPELLKAALTDVTSTTWVTPPAYVAELAGLITVGRPLVEAFGVQDLPATGNKYTYPSVKTPPNPAEVVGEKVQIPTGAVEIESKEVLVDTIAWGNDVSIQTMERSDPAFLEEWFALCGEYYARRCDLMAYADIVASGTPITNASPVDLLMAVIADAEAGGRSVDTVVGALGFRREVVGSSSVQTLPIAVSDALANMVEDANLPLHTVVAGSREAYSWRENSGAPARLQAVNVSLLGYDLGIYGYAAHEVRYPASISAGTVGP